MRRQTGLALRRAERLARHAAAADVASRRLAGVRLALASAVVAAAATAWAAASVRGPALASCAVALVAFGVAVRAHARVHRRWRLARAVAEAGDRDARRAQGTWRDLPATGEGLARSGREADLAADLAILGEGSLFQMLSRCATPWGERRLGDLLLLGEPAPDLPLRQEAVRELAALGAFRRRLEAEGRLAPDVRGAEALARDLAMPSFHDSRRWVAPACAALGAATCLQVVVAGAWGVPTLVWPCIAVNVAVTAWMGRRLGAEYESWLDRDGPVQAASGILRVLERRRFGSAMASRWHDAVVAPVPASRALADLGALLGALSLRRNALWWPVQALTLWDAWQTARLAAWRRRHGPRLAQWLDVVAEAEACASLAGHAELTGGALARVAPDAPPFSARHLAHPLLPAGKSVANDVGLQGDGRILLLTGSNMSGKSTLLRAIGANVAIAFAGGAATAASLSLQPCRLVTSIRVTDALDEGVSLFYAEVRRLRAIVEAAEAGRAGTGLPVLFLIDEILRGTNTRERHAAARALVARLAATGSCGIVTSHDIELTEMDGTVPGVRNAHFREDVREGRMTFDYVLRPGPVTSTNALLILRLEGLDVPEP